YGVKVSDIQAWNGMGRKTRIQVGTSLAVAPPNAQVASASNEAVAASHENGQVHVVRAGEYPAKIAKEYGVDLDEFLEWNHLSKTSMIHVGDKLVVQANKTVASAAGSQGPPATEEIIYTVRAGDSASVIAEKHGVGLSDLLRWNGLTRKSTLQVGKKLVIHKTATASQDTAKEEVVVHKVAKGQNPTTIARLYGVSVDDLLKWNGWDRNRILRVGDTVTIRRN
ncbi:MAG: LysM peptidoglycan-binding domain-containing protein, partial [Candidatus Hydrogenedentes bacterium]|nr:LysM peptidoglycan-binding domain-containing protein [Candidatus Hydrogenedentota bacterium]